MHFSRRLSCIWEDVWWFRWRKKLPFNASLVFCDDPWACDGDYQTKFFCVAIFSRKLKPARMFFIVGYRHRKFSQVFFTRPNFSPPREEGLNRSHAAPWWGARAMYEFIYKRRVWNLFHNTSSHSPAEYHLIQQSLFMVVSIRKCCPTDEQVKNYVRCTL